MPAKKKLILYTISVVGLPDKAVSEARDRVRSAFSAMSIALPSKRITINLSPADLPKEGSHFDLPIALALLAALEIVPADMAAETIALGELSLDGTLIAVLGALPAAMTAAELDKTLLCPAASGAEAAWVGAATVCGANSLHGVIQHFTGQSPIAPPRRERRRRMAVPKTCGMSKDRSAPNARWKSLPPAAIIS